MCHCPPSASWLTRQRGELEDGTVVKLVSPRGLLRGDLGPVGAPGLCSLKLGADGSFLCGCGRLSAPLSLPSKPLLRLHFRKEKGLPSFLWAPLLCKAVCLS